MKENLSALEEIDSLRTRSPSIPRTVQDAITFAAQLGYRYLWVDSLCIVQDDRSEKHDQIAMMHLIYSAAHATIVQHTGSDANAGLPGVRLGSRSLIATKTHVIPKKTEAHDFIMMATANYSVPGIFSASMHSTRGWTLQEVLLSARCLHFFDKQVTFVCTQEYVQDWRAPLQESSEPSDYSVERRTQSYGMSPYLMGQMNPLSLAHTSSGYNRDVRITEWLRNFEIYARILTDYTSRQLTYESDILYAFQGLGFAISNISGGTISFGLPTVSFDLALLWINLGSGKKRCNMRSNSSPTWSWAAWVGQSTFNFCRTSGDPGFSPLLNSYVRNFYVIEKGKPHEIQRKSIQSQQVTLVLRQTPYYNARVKASEADFDMKKARSWPDGCLFFWAEECTMDQFSVKISEEGYSFLHLLPSEKCCGVLALSPEFRTTEMLLYDIVSGLKDSNYSLLLMSECEKSWTKWPPVWDHPNKKRFERKDVYDYHSEFFDGEGWRDCWYFNVMLVQKVGQYFERIAVGQVHMLAWLEAKQRRRRQIRLI